MTCNDAKGVADRDETNHALGDTRAALDAVLRNTEAMANLQRTAERYARVRRGAWEACDLVWDVLGDLMLGDLTCDPARPLAPQLAQEVRRRANRLLRGKRPRREAPQLVLVDLEKASTSALVLDGPHESHGHSQGPDPAELLSRVRDQARQDPPALQLLALYGCGITSRRDVLNTGMTDWAYRAARERLAAYAANSAAAETATHTASDCTPCHPLAPVWARRRTDPGQPARCGQPARKSCGNAGAGFRDGSRRDPDARDKSPRKSRR